MLAHYQCLSPAPNDLLSCFISGLRQLNAHCYYFLMTVVVLIVLREISWIFIYYERKRIMSARTSQIKRVHPNAVHCTCSCLLTLYKNIVGRGFRIHAVLLIIHCSIFLKCVGKFLSFPRFILILTNNTKSSFPLYESCGCYFEMYFLKIWKEKKAFNNQNTLDP
jgi:hypothetical protein